MKISVYFSLALMLGGCASSLDIAKFKQDVGLQETDGSSTVSRCAYIPFSYGRQRQGSYEQCAYIQNSSGFSIYLPNNTTQHYKKRHDIPYRNIECAIYYTSGPSKGVIAFFTSERMFQVSLLDSSRDTANLSAIDNALVGLRDREIKVHRFGSEVANPLFVYTFTLNNICTNSGEK
jgi:hypothetical protein